MENYIVRIYRRDTRDPGKVTGVLESVEQQTRQPFSHLDTLHLMLEQDGDDHGKAAAAPTAHALLHD